MWAPAGQQRQQHNALAAAMVWASRLLTAAAGLLEGDMMQCKSTSTEASCVWGAAALHLHC
jgi:hypothetical protein